MAEALFPQPIEQSSLFVPKKGSAYKLISSDPMTLLEGKTLGNKPALQVLPTYFLTNRIYKANKCFLETVAVIFECLASIGT